VAERATKACNSCVVSKVKCDNERPCKRCQKKGFTCLTKSSDSSPFPQILSADQQQVYPRSTEPQNNPDQFVNGLQVDEVYLDEQNADAQALLDLYNTTGYNQHTIPAFFEQIMVPAPDFMGADYMQAPPDLMAWMPEVDWLGQVDIFGNDFTPVIDQMLEAQVLQDVTLPLEKQPAGNKDSPHEKIDSNSAKRRHAAFKQSAWYSLPMFVQTSADYLQVLDSRTEFARF